MTLGPFLSKDWMCANPDYNCSDWVMIGLPFDMTCSNKPGTRFASQAMRTASWGLEEYSPIVDKDFNDTKFFVEKRRKCSYFIIYSYHIFYLILRY